MFDLENTKPVPYFLCVRAKQEVGNKTGYLLTSEWDTDHNRLLSWPAKTGKVLGQTEQIGHTAFKPTIRKIPVEFMKEAEIKLKCLNHKVYWINLFV